MKRGRRLWPWARKSDEWTASPASLAADQLREVEADTLDVQKAARRLWAIQDHLGPLIAEALREGPKR